MNFTNFDLSSKKSDLNIIKEIFVEYMWNISYIRYLLVPSFAMMLLAVLLELQMAETLKNFTIILSQNQNPTDILIKFIIIKIISNIFCEIQYVLICRAGQKGNTLACKNMYKYMLNQKPEKYDKNKIGEIQNMVIKKGQAVQDIINTLILNFIPTVIALITISYKTFKGLGVIPLIIVNFSVLMYIIITIKMTIWRNNFSYQKIAATNQASNKIIDSLLNFENVYFKNTKNYEVYKYENELERLEKINLKLYDSQYFLNFLQRTVWCVQAIIIIPLSVYGIFIKKMGSEDLMYYISISGLLSMNLGNVGYMYSKCKDALVDIRSTCDCCYIVEYEQRQLHSLNEKIEIKNLSFNFNQQNILENVNLVVKKGEKIALIGENGVGKSTLLKILGKMYEPIEGKIFVDEIDISEISNESYFKKFVFIPQKVTLFDNTVMYNITYGLSYLINENKIYQISKKYNFHDFILSLKDGYETKVGEQGKSLSAAESQKIILLRALLQKKDVLIMDEATSSIDNKSEYLIFKEILKQEKLTVIAIVQNKELLHLFDRVLEIKNKTLKEN